MTPGFRILLFFQLVTSMAISQVFNSLGFQSGPAYSMQSWNMKHSGEKLERGYRTGFYGAGTVDFLNSDYFNITSDIGYCEKGFSEKVEFQSASSLITYEDKMLVSYWFLNNSFKVKYKIKKWLPFAQLGFLVDYLTSYEMNYDPRYFHQWIAGLTAGAGIEFKTGRMGIYCMGQYLSDLTSCAEIQPVYDAGGVLSYSGIEITNKAYVMSLGVRYYMKKKDRSELIGK